MSDFQTEAAAVANLSADPLQHLPDGAGGNRYDAIMLRDDYSVKDIEHLLPNRRRFRGEFATFDVAAFFKYMCDAQEKNIDEVTDLVQVFVDEKSMSAKSYIDYVSEGMPGHCDHTAKLSLQRTPLYKEIGRVEHEAMKPKEAADWIEDQAHNLTFMSASHKPISVQSVLSAVRNMTIERARTSGHEVAQLKESASLMESTEAKAKVGQVPAYIKCTDRCFENLEETTFAVRFSVLTGMDQVRFKFSLINQAELAHERAVAFAALLESQDCAQVVVRMGTFAP